MKRTLRKDFEAHNKCKTDINIQWTEDRNAMIITAEIAKFHKFLAWTSTDDPPIYTALFIVDYSVDNKMVCETSESTSEFDFS